MSARSGTAIVATGLRKTYEDNRVLDLERLEIERGRITAVIGPSGAGKSTLLRVLGLLERADSGEIVMDGVQVGSETSPASVGVTVVFQEPTLLRGTVGYNVGYGLAARGVGGPERRRRVTEALELVGLADRVDSVATKLSGGEAQRVALARALVTEPSVLLLDEPLASLDEPLRRRLSAEFAGILRQKGCSVLWVTHDQAEAAEVADRAVILDGGAVVASGPVNEVLDAPTDEWTASFLGRSAPMKGHAVTSQEGVVTVDCAGSIVVGIGDAQVGEAVSVRVAPDDVVIYEADADLPVSSARNVLRMSVESIHRSGAARVVMLSSGNARLTATVLPVSARELGLEPGLPVTVVFKATAAGVLPFSEEGEAS